jgi:hypothetical protein
MVLTSSICFVTEGLQLLSNFSNEMQCKIDLSATGASIATMLNATSAPHRMRTQVCNIASCCNIARELIATLALPAAVLSVRFAAADHPLQEPFVDLT